MNHHANTIRSVAVTGSGPAAWIAASGLARAFRTHGLAVTVVETGAGPDEVGCWTLPSQRGIHGLLGINESHFIQHTGATFKLATEHVGWQGEGSGFLHAYGEIGTDLDGTPFYKLLQREAAAGRPLAAETFSLAGMAARLGKFARPMGTDLTASFTYAFHVETSRYVNYLREHARRLAVREAAAPLADVVLSEAGDIEMLRLADGSQLEADFYLDCSGGGSLISRVSGAEREDWAHWLPCDRMISGAAPGVADLPPLTQTFAVDAGWQWRSPLAAGVMAGCVFSSAHQSEEAARVALNTFQPGLQEPLVSARLRAGRRREFWSHNCVALGEAAMELEPLAGASLHFAQVGLATLIELFPLNRQSRIEAHEFNRVMIEQADALRDFTLAQYRAGRARAGAFWNDVRAPELPTTLAQRLDQYAASGRITMRDHESFEEIDWAWLLIGSGCVPAAMEVQTRDRLAKLSAREVETLHQQLRQLAASMPSHAEFVRRQASPAPGTRSA